jgi:hypothetical protein
LKLLSRDKIPAIVAPVYHASIPVFDQTFSEKVCDKTFFEKACVTPLYHAAMQVFVQAFSKKLVKVFVDLHS